MDLQKLIDSLNEHGCAVRGDYHLTLGGLRDALNAAPNSAHVVYDVGDPYPGSFFSYRGYYTDIAIGEGNGPVTVAEFKKATAKALKTTFEGYKGGEFPATPDKPLWRAGYGNATGIAVVGTRFDGENLVLITKLID